jgi:hypothetical protein
MPSAPDAAAAAVAAAEAAAAKADTVAQTAYQLSMQILEEGQFELMPELVALVAESIQEGMSAYTAVGVAAKSAEAQAQALYTQFTHELRRKM